MTAHLTRPAVTPPFHQPNTFSPFLSYKQLFSICRHPNSDDIYGHPLSPVPPVNASPSPLFCLFLRPPPPVLRCQPPPETHESIPSRHGCLTATEGAHRSVFLRLQDFFLSTPDPDACTCGTSGINILIRPPVENLVQILLLPQTS